MAAPMIKMATKTRVKLIFIIQILVTGVCEN